jgi:hypothetical protein
MTPNAAATEEITLMAPEVEKGWVTLKVVKVVPAVARPFMFW